jgi:ABC-2 type transport system permease protein
MSAAEAARADLAGTPAGAGPGAAGVPGPLTGWLRLLGSELRLILLRIRNLILLAVLAAIPVIIGIAVWLQGGPSGGGGPAFLAQLTGNGIFLAFLSLTVLLTLVLPLVVAVVSGDSIAGEASHGTLRYLLAVPAGRMRLLGVKYTAIVIFCVIACLVVAGVGLIAGIALFGTGPVTLLSGTSVALGDGLLRLLLVTLYVAAGMAALGAIGMAISTLTEHPIAAIAAILVITVASEVTDQVSQFAVVHPYLPTHWWLSFDALLRSPVDWTQAGQGLVSFCIYAVIFCLFAWARLATADVTS